MNVTHCDSLHVTRTQRRSCIVEGAQFCGEIIPDGRLSQDRVKISESS
jgi:hypothetical protein